MPASEVASDERIHVERTGNGPDLVLLHGWAMHGGIFAPLVEALGERWTVHVVDLPGHGHSRSLGARFRLDAVAMEVLEVMPMAVWVGWSMGGLIAQRAALMRPERVRGLVTIASTPCFVRAPGWPDAVEADVFRQFADDLTSNRRRTLERFLALEVVGSDNAGEQLRRLRELLFARGEPAAHVLADGLDLLERTDLRAELPALAVPSLWLAGIGDRLVPWRSVQAAAELAGGRYSVQRGAGHAPFLVRPTAVADAIAGLELEPQLVAHSDRKGVR